MKNKNDNLSIPPERPVEKLTFGIAEKNPIKVISHNFNSKQESKYDMHYGFELGILLSGRMKRYYKDHELNLTPGQTWLCGMWEPHGWQITTAPCQAIVLIIFPPLLVKSHLEEIYNINLLTPFNQPAQNRPAVSKSKQKIILDIGRSLKSSLFSKKELNSAWVLLKLLEILLILHDNWQSSQPENIKHLNTFSIVNKAANLVFENNSFITAQQAARICGVNRNTFASLFKQTMGLSFAEFSLRFRISSAAKEISAGIEPLKSIAKKWGFTDTSHLNKCFKKYYGYPPGKHAKTI